MKKYALLLIAVFSTLFCASATAEAQSAEHPIHANWEKIKEYTVIQYTFAAMNAQLCKKSKEEEKKGYENLYSQYSNKSIDESDYSNFCDSLNENSWPKTRENFTEKLHKYLTESNFLSDCEVVFEKAGINKDLYNNIEEYRKAQSDIFYAIIGYCATKQQVMKANDKATQTTETTSDSASPSNNQSSQSQPLVYFLAAISAILTIIIAILTFIVKQLTYLCKLCEEKMQDAKPTETSQSSTDKAGKSIYQMVHSGSGDNDNKGETTKPTPNDSNDGSDNNSKGRLEQQDDKHKKQNQPNTTATTAQHTIVYATESNNGLKEDSEDYAHYEIKTFDQQKGKFKILEGSETDVINCIDNHKPFCNILSQKGNKRIKTTKEGTVHLSNDKVWIVDTKADIELTD